TARRHRGRARPFRAWAIPRFSVPLGASLVLRAKPLHYMRRAVIAPAAWHVIFVVTAPFDRTGGLDEYASRRVTWARGAHQGSVFFPMPPICRFSKAPLPCPTALFAVLFLGGGKAAPRVGLEVQRPPFSHEPFIKSGIHAFDSADAYPPVRMDFIRPLVLASNAAAVGNQLGQRITRIKTAL